MPEPKRPPEGAAPSQKFRITVTERDSEWSAGNPPLLAGMKCVTDTPGYGDEPAGEDSLSPLADR